MSVAILCHVDPAREPDRLRLRPEHLAYIAEHRHLIVAGGPTLHEDGTLDTMILLLDLPDIAAGDAFIRIEPYAAHGVFDHIEVHAWSRVLPE